MGVDQGPEELKTGKRTSNSNSKLVLHLSLEELFNHVFDPPISSFHDHPNRICLTPLSSEACRIHGIDPDALVKRDYDTFRVAGQINEGIQRLRFDAYDRRRHEWMKTALEERGRLRRIACAARSTTGDSESKSLTPSTAFDQQAVVTSHLIENEEKRLLKAKERQKKELMQLLKMEQVLTESQREQRIKIEQERRYEQQKRLEKRKRDKFIAEERRLRQLRKKAEEDRKEEILKIAAKRRFQSEAEARAEMLKRAWESKKQAQMQQLERMQKLHIIREQNELLQEKRRLEVQRNLDLREAREAQRFEKLEAKRLADMKAVEMKRLEVAKRIEANKMAAQQRDQQRMLELVEKRKKSKELQDRLAAERQRKYLEEAQQKEALSRKREYQAKLSRSKEEAVIEEMVRKIQEGEKIVEKQQMAKLKKKILMKQERAVNEEIKKENVDRFKRIEEYRRLCVLRKIEEENKKTECMLKKKSEITEQRRRAALQVKIEKDLLMEQIDKTKRIGGRSMEKLITSLETCRPNTNTVPIIMRPKGQQSQVRSERDMNSDHSSPSIDQRPLGLFANVLNHNEQCTLESQLEPF